MSTVVSIDAKVRQGTGKGKARSLRREGKVPAIIYGGKQEPVNVEVETRSLVKEINKGGFRSRLVEIRLGDEVIRTLPRDVQLHPVTDIPEHADFLRLDKDSKINVKVKVNFIGHEKSPGIKRGGIVNVVRHEVELLCLPDSIPLSITIDISELTIGDSVHASSAALPEGAEYVIKDRDFTIATIVGRMAQEEEAVAAPVEGAEGEEGSEEGEEEGDEKSSKE